MDRPILVLCPLEIESKAARQARGDRASVVTIGPGPAAVRKAFAARRIDPDSLVILFGVAGGLTDGPVSPPINQIIDANTGDRWTPTHTPQSDHAGVALVGVEEPITSPAEKRALQSRTDGALVDTESHVFARLCVECNLSWAVVRGVSDGPDQTLPTQVVNWVNDAGQTRTAQVCLDLLRSPMLTPQVVRLARSTNRALAAASIQLRALIDEATDTISPS